MQVAYNKILYRFKLTEKQIDDLARMVVVEIFERQVFNSFQQFPPHGINYRFVKICTYAVIEKSDDILSCDNKSECRNDSDSHLSRYRINIRKQSSVNFRICQIQPN